MAINRVAGLVLPASTKFLVDDVIGQARRDLLLPLSAVVLVATLVQGATSFAMTQLLSKAAQRLIADLRRQVQAHVGRLPVAYYDANKAGTLVSRIMHDVEGIRNLIGTGLVEFAGGLLTSALALVLMLRISPLMTGVSVLRAERLRRRARCARWAPCGRSSASAARSRRRSPGRLTESLGGVRVIKGYHAEAREEAVFAAGVGRLLENVLKTLTAMSVMGLASSVLLGRGERGGDVRGRAADPRRPHHAGRLLHLHAAARVPGRAALPGGRRSARSSRRRRRASSARAR